MRIMAFLAIIALLAGCYSNQDRWLDFYRDNNCIATGQKKTLLAGSIFKIPQSRVVYEFQCGTNKVWSDLGNYGRYNEWLQI